MTFDDIRNRKQISSEPEKQEQSNLVRPKQNKNHSESVNQKNAHQKPKNCCGQRNR